MAEEGDFAIHCGDKTPAKLFILFVRIYLALTKDHDSKP